MARARMAAAAVVLMLATAACGTAAGQTTPASSPAPLPARSGVSPADVAFMRGMIAHHGQALAMTALVPARTAREDLRLLARRIDISQQGEIAMMRRWLADRGQDTTAAPMQHDMHGAMPGMQHPTEMMPGMLTPEEMARLAAATGPEFERLFLEGMIRHHQGALVMVEQLLAAPGAAQEPETFRFASDVDADQRAEIARMQGLLAAIQTPR